jgi:UDP-N-acetylmuramate dehydrogenase
LIPDDACRAALDLLGEIARADEPLAPYTTYRVGGSAAVFAVPRSRDDLAVIANALRLTALPVLVVGRGSNLLVADAGFRGIAVSLAEFADTISIAEPVEADDEHAHLDSTHRSVIVTAEAACALPVVARRTVAAGLAGFEWAVGVPGSIGGAVRMNAGGHGADIAGCLVEVELFDLRSAAHDWVAADRLGLRFRGSDIADHQIVLAARLRLHHGDQVASEAMLSDIVKWRREHQPGGQNAGSVFVNPIPGELAAAQLIDRLGLRGYAVGGAHVSDKHANFVQAGSGATAQDVLRVMRHVRATVAAEAGFELRSEVRLVGFEDLAPHEHHESAGVTW